VEPLSTREWLWTHRAGNRMTGRPAVSRAAARVLTRCPFAIPSPLGHFGLEITGREMRNQRAPGRPCAEKRRAAGATF
jgi:hypothetical protein